MTLIVINKKEIMKEIMNIFNTRINEINEILMLEEMNKIRTMALMGKVDELKLMKKRFEDIFKEKESAE